MKISYSVVLFNNDPQKIFELYRNIIQTTPQEYCYSIYFINNSPLNMKISETLENISQSDDHVIAINASENRGFGAGHNLAIKSLDSDYHFLVNPDIIIPDATQIETIISYMNTNNIVLLSPLIKDKKGNIQKLTKHNPTVFDMGLRFVHTSFFLKRQDWFVYSTEYSKIHAATNLSGSFLACKTTVLKEVQGFDERYFLYMEDADLSRTLSQHGLAIFFPEAYVIHEWQRQNQKSFKGILQMISSMMKYFNKWGWQLW